MPTPFPIPTAPSDTTRIRLAYESSRDDIAAVQDSELLPVNVDVSSATATILGAVSKIAPFAAALAGLPGFDPRWLIKLEPYTLALYGTHGAYLRASRPPEAIPELVQAATQAREVLRADAVALSKRGLFDPKVLERYQGTSGHKAISLDILLLCGGFRERWADIQGKTALTEEELDRAEMIDEQLITAIGVREQAPSVVASAQLERQRAFTLVVRTYDEIRRGLAFLRHHDGDLEEIAPSIYAGRGGRRRAGDDESVVAPAPGAQAEAPAPGAPGATPAATPAGNAPRTISFANVPSASEDVPAGYPGSSPFVRS